MYFWTLGVFRFTLPYGFSVAYAVFSIPLPDTGLIRIAITFCNPLNFRCIGFIARCGIVLGAIFTSRVKKTLTGATLSFISVEVNNRKEQMTHRTLSSSIFVSHGMDLSHRFVNWSGWSSVKAVRPTISLYQVSGAF